MAPAHIFASEGVEWCNSTTVRLDNNTEEFHNLEACSFVITKVECPSENTKKVCVQAIEPVTGCDPNWELYTLDQDNNRTNVDWAPGLSTCFVFTDPNQDFYIEYNCGPNTCSQGIKGINCNPNKCDSIDITATTEGCKTKITVAINSNCRNVRNAVIDFGDGSPPMVIDDPYYSEIYHKYPGFEGGTYEICVTWSDDGCKIESFAGNEGEEAYNQVFATCCTSVNIPPIDPCACSSMDTATCVTTPHLGGNSGFKCCKILTFNHPYIEDADHYTWVIEDLDGNKGIVTFVTNDNTLEHTFTGTSEYKICVTVTLKDQSEFECCYTFRFHPIPCQCCTITADFIIYYVPQSCIKDAVSVDPTCDDGSANNPNITHVWEYSDGAKYYGKNPPPYIFTDFYCDGNVCVTHKVYCHNILIDTKTKCLSFPKGIHIGIKGAKVYLTDSYKKHLDNTGFEYDPPPGKTIYDLIKSAEGTNIPVYIDEKVTLIINIDANFNSSHWIMGLDTKVLVKSKHFDLNLMYIEVKKQLCCWWIGIKVEPGSYLNWYGTTISDATIMLNLIETSSQNRTYLDIKKCNFNSNLTGIYWQNHVGTVKNFYQNSFHNPVDCNDRDPSDVCGCCFNIAIHLDNVRSGVYFPRNSSTDGPNTIHGYKTGILSENTSLKVRNFIMEDLRESVDKVTGTGIYYVKDEPRYHYLDMDYMWFYKMRTAVFLEASGGGYQRLRAVASQPLNSITIQDDITRGFYINIYGNTRLFRRSEIRGNLIKTAGNLGSNYGIYLSIPQSNRNKLFIKNNEIESAGINSNIGIALYSGSTAPQNVSILNNSIKCNGFNDGAGVYLHSWNNALVKNNTINTSDQKPGIELHEGANNRILCNDINNSLYGIFLDGSVKNTIAGNTVFDCKQSMYINDDCMSNTGTFIGWNTFDLSTFESNLYTRTGFTGIQAHSKYNSWLQQNNNTPPDNVEVRLLNKDLWSLNYFYAPPNTLQGHVHHAYKKPVEMFQTKGNAISDPNPYCGGNGGGGGTEGENGGGAGYPAPFPAEQAGAYYDTLAEYLDTVTGIPPAMQASLEQSIYFELLRHPDWMSAYPGLDTFYQTHQYDYIGQSAGVYKLLSNWAETLENQYAVLTPLAEAMEPLLDQLESLDSILVLETDPAAIAAIELDIAQVSSDIESLEAQIQAINSTQEAENAGWRASLQSEVSALSPVENWQAEETAMLDILFKWIDGQSPSLADSLSIDVMAQACIEDYDRAVRLARGLGMVLYGIYYPPLDCPPSGNGARKAAAESSAVTQLDIRLVPNPAGDNCMLYLNSYSQYGKEARIEVSLFGAGGGTRDLSPVYKGDGAYLLSLHEFENGVYFIRVVRENKLATSKLVIIR